MDNSSVAFQFITLHMLSEETKQKRKKQILTMLIDNKNSNPRNRTTPICFSQTVQLNIQTYLWWREVQLI